jgi:hypothetical protein
MPSRARPADTSAIAIATLVCAVIGVAVAPLSLWATYVAWVASLLCGWIGSRQIAAADGRQSGRRLIRAARAIMLVALACLVGAVIVAGVRSLG